MSYQETSFVTIGQRLLANPLRQVLNPQNHSFRSVPLSETTKTKMFFSLSYRVRFHYGHPDVFDRIFHITRGGISKASRTINLSEDVFAGTKSHIKELFLSNFVRFSCGYTPPCIIYRLQHHSKTRMHNLQ